MNIEVKNIKRLFSSDTYVVRYDIIDDCGCSKTSKDMQVDGGFLTGEPPLLESIELYEIYKSNKGYEQD